MIVITKCLYGLRPRRLGLQFTILNPAQGLDVLYPTFLCLDFLVNIALKEPMRSLQEKIVYVKKSPILKSRFSL